MLKLCRRSLTRCVAAMRSVPVEHPRRRLLTVQSEFTGNLNRDRSNSCIVASDRSSISIQRRYNHTTNVAPLEWDHNISKQIPLKALEKFIMSSNKEKGGTLSELKRALTMKIKRYVPPSSDIPFVKLKAPEDVIEGAALLEGPFGRAGGIVMKLDGNSWCIAIHHPLMGLQSAWAQWQKRVLAALPEPLFKMRALYVAERDDMVQWTAFTFTDFEAMKKLSPTLHEVIEDRVRCRALQVAVSIVSSTEGAGEPRCMDDKTLFYTTVGSDNSAYATMKSSIQVKLDQRGFCLIPDTSYRRSVERITQLSTKEASESSSTGGQDESSFQETVGWLGYRDGMIVVVVRSTREKWIRAGQHYNGGLLREASLGEGYAILYAPLVTDSATTTTAIAERIKDLRQSVDLWHQLSDCSYYNGTTPDLRFNLHSFKESLRPPVDVENFVDPGITFAFADGVKHQNLAAAMQSSPFNWRTLLVSGPSGGGKTVTALWCIKMLGPNAFGIYVNTSGLGDNVQKVQTRIVSEIVNLLAPLLEKLPSSPQEDSASLLIVLDEMGDKRGVVEAITNEGATFEQTIRQQVMDGLIERRIPHKMAMEVIGDSSTFYSFSWIKRNREALQKAVVDGIVKRGALKLYFAVVGTGVGTVAKKDLHAVSLHKTYVIVKNALEPTAHKVFESTFERVMARRMNEQLGHPIDITPQRATKALRIVQKKELLHLFLTNMRCSHVLAEHCAQLCFPAYDGEDQWIIQNCALSLAVAVSYFYISTNGWQAIRKNKLRMQKLFSYLVSLVVTQRHGYTIVPPDELEDLIKVGAIEDLAETSFELKEPPHHDKLFPNDLELKELYRAHGATSLIPTCPDKMEKGITTYFTTLIPFRSGNREAIDSQDYRVRYAVNPAVVVV